MKKVLILALCMLCILSGCKNGKVNDEQQKIYYGLKEGDTFIITGGNGIGNTNLMKVCKL